MELTIEHLTVEQLTGVIGSLDRRIVPRDEPRSQPRAALDMDATIIPIAFSERPGPAEVEVRDLSRSGMGFYHDRRMSLDEQFVLVLSQENDTPALVLCSVAFWEPLAGDMFAIGAGFVRVLRDAGTPLPLHFLPAQAQVEAFRLRKAS